MSKDLNFNFTGSCRFCSCSLKCFPGILNELELRKLESIINLPKFLNKKEILFYQGDTSNNLYIVRSGCIKTVLTKSDGSYKITGFYLPSELVGLDALDDHRHDCTAISTVPTYVCKIPKTFLENTGSRYHKFYQYFMRLISDEFNRDHESVYLLTKTDSFHRVAIFILGIHNRITVQCLNDDKVLIPINRTDMADHLGITVETCSRAVSKMLKLGILASENRMLRILDIEKLKEIADIK